MKRVLPNNINTVSYWNKVLKSGQWGRERGNLYCLLRKYFPTDRTVTALDIGCGAGHGVVKLSRKLPNVTFEACDFSPEGVRHGERLYGSEIHFFVHNIYKDKLQKSYDYILLIEILEHVKDPISTVEKYLNHCNEKMLVTVPYNESGWKEHVWVFNEYSFTSIATFRGYSVFTKPGTNEHIILFIFQKP